MKKLETNETELVGSWIVNGAQVESDEICRRIEWLVKEVLEQVGTDSSGWDILYQDPEDFRFWELIYPQSHMHGGGPPALYCISVEDAKEKYDF